MPIPKQLRGGLIVSCQAWDDDPLNDPDVLRRMAEAALLGGAQGLRASDARNIAAMRAITAVPIIGIRKRYSGKELRITPDFESARSIAEAGADIVAIECTDREALFGERWPDILRRIHQELHLPVLADISTFEEAQAAANAGADAVATTLAGYTPESQGVTGVAWDLLRECVERLSVPVIAEGHIATPRDAARVLQMGAYAAVVGSAITRPKDITQTFVRAIQAPTSGTWVIGVDIGGTNVKAALVNGEGELMFPEKVPTMASAGAESIAAAAEKAITAVLAADEGKRALRGIGISSAGAIDVETGTVFAATENLPGWTGFPLRAHFVEMFGLPVFVENDGHAAALAELHFGKGRSFNDFVVISLGTGLGGGIIQNRQLLRGTHGFGGGIGHHTINFESGPKCNCGRRGCLETYVSGNALVRNYSLATGNGPILSEEIVRRATLGEAAAIHTLNRMAAALGEGLANIWSFVDPEAVILTGGISQVLPGFQEKMMAALNVSLPFSSLRKPRVLFSESSVFSGVQGAAAAVFEGLLR